LHSEADNSKAYQQRPYLKDKSLSKNPLTGYVFDFEKIPGKLVGYAAYFRLLNGFEKTLYMSVEELNQHGLKYSQTFKKGFGLWKDDFDAMASKTVLKQLLTKYAPLSVEMQKAVISDQATIEDAESMDVTYIDNEQPTNKQVAATISEDEKLKRLTAAIMKAATIADLDKLRPYIDETNLFICDAFNAKKKEIKEAANVQ
jgi:recombination protein RecT